MSSTRTGGSGRPSARSRSSSRGSACQVSGRGVAEPDQQRRAGPRARARRPPAARRSAGRPRACRTLSCSSSTTTRPRPLDRREDRRARADRDPRLARAQPPPLVVALALAERGVQQRDGVAEARLEAPDRLRRQRDLRHEHDHALPALERPRRGAQVDLGLARAGDAVQEVLAAVLDRRAAPPPAPRSARPRGRRAACVSGSRRSARSAIVTSPRFSSRRSDPRSSPAGPRQPLQQRALAPRSAARRRAARPCARPTAAAAASPAAAARARARAPASRRTRPPSTARARPGPAAPSPRAPRSARRAARAAARSRPRARRRRRRASGGRTGPCTTDPTSTGASGSA